MTGVEVHEPDEWSAVYLDGQLVRQGDPYLADEWVREHFGVVTVQDSAFMRGSDRREDVAKTLDEVRTFAEQRRLNRQRADELDAHAAELTAEAAKLRKL